MAKKIWDKTVECICCFPLDVLCFIYVAYLLCKEDPFESDTKKEERRKKEIEKQLAKEYRENLEKDHEPEEVEIQVALAKDMISRKARIMAKPIDPTFNEKAFDRFHYSLERWPIYIAFAYVITFIAVAAVILRNS